MFSKISPWYGVDQLAARNVIRVDQLDPGKYVFYSSNNAKELGKIIVI